MSCHVMLFTCIEWSQWCSVQKPLFESFWPFCTAHLPAQQATDACTYEPAGLLSHSMAFFAAHTDTYHTTELISFQATSKEPDCNALCTTGTYCASSSSAIQPMIASSTQSLCDMSAGYAISQQCTLSAAALASHRAAQQAARSRAQCSAI